MRAILPWALAVSSGTLLILSFPKYGHGALAWAALAPLLVALERTRGLRAAALGYVCGFVAAVGVLYWTALVAQQYGGLSLIVSIGVMVLMCMAVALFTALFAWLSASWRNAWGPEALLLSPVAWVASEILRAYTLLRFPWCLLGYSQHDNLPVIQIASYTAVYGVSFLVALCSAVLALSWLSGRSKRTWLGLALMAAALFTCWIFGVVRMRSANALDRMRVGLVQASIPQDEKWEARHAMRNVERHIALTRSAVAQGARLVVWPESALPYYYDLTPPVARMLRELTRENRIHLLFGNDDREDEGRVEKVYVGAKLLAPDGRLTLRYHKLRLVPFGEYVPLAALLERLGVQKLVQEVGSFTPGDEPRVGPLAGHRVSVTICYEAIFPDLVRRFTHRGSELLVNVTNDAWYGRTSAPYQHFAMARFRAVENGRYLLRAANTGISAIVDPHGRIVARTTLFERTALVGEAAFVSEPTFYARHGDVFAWSCFALALALSAAAYRRRRRD